MVGGVKQRMWVVSDSYPTNGCRFQKYTSTTTTTTTTTTTRRSTRSSCRLSGMAPVVYFCASIRGGRQHRVKYTELVRLLNTYGRVLNPEVGSVSLQEAEAIGTLLGDKKIHDRDVQWLEEADVVVAEVTQPSLGVGYEIGRAVAMKKPILCLFRPETGLHLSAMVRGAHDGSNIIVRDYGDDDLAEILREFFKPYLEN
uniref:5-hydroxymethyl-dUMP N-hydrolase isoform X1 n=1 Tax=Myxine glutinosa TaxID=7769 RepID=UPI00358E26C6